MTGRVLAAFLRRDALTHLSYRLEFGLDALSVVFSAATFYYVSRLLGAGLPALGAYGGGYFPFVLVGLAFSGIQAAGLHSFSSSLRQEQYLGTLEPILASPVRLPALLAASAQYDFLYAAFRAALYLAAARALFGLRFGGADWLCAGIVALLSLACFTGLGALSAAFTLHFKRGDPATWLTAALSDLLGGVYFPPALLPEWLQSLGAFVPLTHALEGLRRALLQGASAADVWPQLAALAAMAAILVPAGLWAFSRAVAAARRDGTLSHY